MDFFTKKINPSFNIDLYLEKIIIELKAYGYEFSSTGKNENLKAVQSRFLKDDSIKKLLQFKHVHHPEEKIKIKLEIDTNPPLGAQFLSAYVSFPVDFHILTYDLPSLMAGKIHAKGRDWFDFLWYLDKKITPNWKMIQTSFMQSGPWKEMPIIFDAPFIKKTISQKIDNIDWKQLINDIRPFLSSMRLDSLRLWSKEFFNHKLSVACW